MTTGKVLLINPPLWNVYAPHLAVPLLVGTLKDRGWDARGLDLGIAHVDWLLGQKGLAEIGERIDDRLRAGLDGEERRRIEEALLLLPSVTMNVDGARQVLRSIAGLADHESFRWASRVMANGLRCISAAFEGLSYDLQENAGFYSPRSTRQVCEATTDPDRNVYRWVFDRILPEALEDPGLGLVGISLSADTQLVAAMTATRIVRERRPDVHVVMGGNFATRIADRWTAGHPFFELVDECLLYEGEESLPLLCEELFAGGVAQIPGRVRPRPGGTLERTPPRAVDLGTVPAPDFSDYSLDSYLAPGPVLPMLASRSCVWNCTFCSIPFASNKFRMREPDAIVDEMVELSTRYRTRYFMFVDEIMTQRTLKGVSAEIVERKLDLRWYGETRFSSGWTRELADAVYESGCRRLDFGLESFNQRVLDLMKKETKVDYIPDNIECLLAAGVPLHLFVITGFPGETEEEARRTVEFSRSVIERSKDEYGVPYTTWATSPFIFDVLSPVGQNPEAFGIRPIPPEPDEDLAMTLDFTVTSGLDQRKSHEIARESKHYYGADLLESGRRFHDAQIDVGDAEEFVFLRACHDTGFPNRTLDRPSLVYLLDRQDRCWLPDGVSWMRSTAVRYSSSSGPVVVLHDSQQDVVVELPARWERRLEAMQTGLSVGEIVAAGGDEEATLDELKTCLRWGVAVTTGRAMESATLGLHTLRFRQEQGSRVRSFGDDGGAELESAVSGAVVTVNALAFLAWMLAGDGIGPADPRLLEAMDDPRSWRRTLERLSTLGLVFPSADLEEGPTGTDRPAAGRALAPAGSASSR